MKALRCNTSISASNLGLSLTVTNHTLHFRRQAHSKILVLHKCNLHVEEIKAFKCKPFFPGISSPGKLNFAEYNFIHFDFPQIQRHQKQANPKTNNTSPITIYNPNFTDCLQTLVCEIWNFIFSFPVPFHACPTQFQWFSSPELWELHSQLDCKLYQGQNVFFYDDFFTSSSIPITHPPLPSCGRNDNCFLAKLCNQGGQSCLSHILLQSMHWVPHDTKQMGQLRRGLIGDLRPAEDRLLEQCPREWDILSQGLKYARAYLHNLKCSQL